MRPRTSVLVIGGDSLIGAALGAELTRRRVATVVTTRRASTASRERLQLDLADARLNDVQLPAADVAVFCAAITGFAASRQDRSLAHRVNVAAPAALARRLTASGTHVILLSTNAVFNTCEPRIPASRPPCPHTVYGALKAEAEAEFLALGPSAAILRLTKVLDPQSSLLKGWIESFSKGKEAAAYGDMRMSPITVRDVAAALLAIAESRAGIFQMSGASAVSYAEVARHLAGRIANPTSRVVEKSALDAGTPAEELGVAPTLDCSDLEALIAWQPPQPFAVVDDVYGPALAGAHISHPVER
jgi:dTDP-4-dehydrorhamnose reductase